MKIEKLTVNIGAEVSGVNLGDAVRDDGFFAKIRATSTASSLWND